MLKNDVKNAKKVTDREGGCKFCGQIAILKAPKEWEQDKIDELATESCSCNDAKVYTKRKERLEKAEKIIHDTFSKPKMQITDQAIETLKRASACMIAREFDSLQLRCGEVTATISAGDGKIIISGTRKEKEGGEA